MIATAWVRAASPRATAYCRAGRHAALRHIEIVSAHVNKPPAPAERRPDPTMHPAAIVIIVVVIGPSLICVQAEAGPVETPVEVMPAEVPPAVIVIEGEI